MDKLFISHLHADHMSDLSAIYCFGPSGDRKWPLYIWGQGPSGVKSPTPPRRLYDDGVKAFCKNLREAMRWHTESFSFLPTSWANYSVSTRQDWGLPHDPVPVGDDAPDDGYGLVPIELDWTKYGKVPGDNVAYDNPKTGVKITHFPVIHTRKGAIGYKLEWNGLTMIYTSDTRPETRSIDQAKNGGQGVDVFIHEMILPPELLAMKNVGLTFPLPPGTNPAFDAAVQNATNVIDSSHTPQGAFGYLLSQIEPRPRLTVIAHFPVADDTVQCALNSVLAHFPQGG
jgi:ribonuclease Z